MFSIAQGQCTKAMKLRLKAGDKYQDISDNGDVVLLLKMIPGIAFDYKAKKYPPLMVYNSIQSFCLSY